MDIIEWDFKSPHIGFNISGFSGYETWGCWTEGSISVIELDKKMLDSHDFSRITLIFKPFCNDYKNLSFTLTTSWGFIEKFNYNESVKTHLSIPLEKSDNYFISFRFDSLISPSQLGISDDSRLIGLGFSRIYLGDSNSPLPGTRTIYIYEHARAASFRENSYSAILSMLDLICSSEEIVGDVLYNFILNNYRSKNINKAINLFIASCALKSIPADDIENYKLAFQLIIDDSFRAKNLVTDFVPLCPSNTLVVVGGFLYSGSGAVYDYLRDLVGSLTLARHDLELPLVEKTFDLFFLNKNSKEALLQYFLSYLLNIFIPSDNRDSINLKRLELSVFEAIINEAGNISSHRYSQEVLRYINKIIFGNRDQQRIAFTDFIAACSGIESSYKNRCIVLNQSPTAMNIQSIQAFDSRLLYFAVHRDPRDQYLDQVNAGLINYGVDGFIKKFLYDRLKFEADINLIDSIDVTLVSFERFVLSHQYREDIRKKTGLMDIKNSNFFIPEVSKKNIGMFKAVSDTKIKEDINKIESSLKQYLFNF